MTMTKQQFKNLYHAYRSMLRYCTQAETLAWIGHYNRYDRRVIEAIVK